MGYSNKTPLFHIPYPAAGQTSDVSEEVYRDQIPEWLIENILRGLAGDDVDATIAQGFLVSDNGGLSISVAAGRGFIDGIAIYKSGASTKSGLTDDDTNYIYLKLTATSDRDRSFTVEASLSGPPVADSILIAVVTTVGGSITDIDNSPSGRAPRIPQTWGGIPQFRVVAVAGGDYTSPKDAIEACNAGDVVFICAGTYALTATITVPNGNITIVGANRDAVILNNTTGSAQTVLDGNGKHGLRISRFTVQTAAGNDGYAIDIDGCNDVEIDHLEVSSTALNRGISANLCARCVIRAAYLHGGFVTTGYGIFLRGDDAILEANLLETPTSIFGIWVQESARPRIHANRLALTGSSYDKSGIRLLNVDRASVQMNNVGIDDPASVGYAINLLNQTTTTRVGGLIVGNHLRGSGDVGTGIMLQGADPYFLDEALVASNVALNFNRGIYLFSAATRESLVHGNKVATCTVGVSDAGTNTNSQDQD